MKHRARGLCAACYNRWFKRGFSAHGPGPLWRQPISVQAAEYAALITTRSAAAAAARIGVSERTITRWRAELRRQANRKQEER